MVKGHMNLPEKELKKNLLRLQFFSGRLNLYLMECRRQKSDWYAVREHISDLLPGILEKHLKSGAYLSALERTAIGSYNVSNAFDLEKFQDYIEQMQQN